jgi:hypothetical protein
VYSIIQSILLIVNGLIGYIHHSLPPQGRTIMFKGLFEARTLTLLILILSVVNALTAILSGHTDIMWGWISATAGWYTVWDLTKNK